MIKALLICPAERPGVDLLAQSAPLANAPVLGQSLIECWLEHLALRGAKQVQVLASDRPQQVRALIGDGSRWGLRVEVIPEMNELSRAETLKKYRSVSDSCWLPEPHDVVLMDHLPGQESLPLFNSYAGYCAALQSWIPHAATPQRVGLKELQPGIWVGLHTHISPSAKLQPPCLLGEHVWVGPGAAVGPDAILDNRAFVEMGAEIRHSVIGPDTFVGSVTQIERSLAWGDLLISLTTGSHLRVTDPFLLCDLKSRPPACHGVAWPGRIAAFLLLVLTLPWALWVVLRAALAGDPPFQKRRAVRPRLSVSGKSEGLIPYYVLAHSNERLQRWPRLWQIACGRFAWVGNPPLDPLEAARLSNDFERLWLKAPIGLFSLADVENCSDPFGDEARAHASFYAVQASRRLNLSILRRALRTLSAPPESAGPPPLAAQPHFSHDSQTETNP